MLLLEGADLADADAVLAAAGAAAGEGVVDDAPDELVGALASPSGSSGSMSEADVEVAVACMSEDAAVEAAAVRARAGEAHRLGELGDGNADVGRPLPAAGHPGRGGVRRRVAGPPEPRASIGIALEHDLGRAFRRGDLLHELEIAVDRLGGAGRLDEEARRLGERRAGVRVDRRDDPGVDQLDPRHPGSGADDGRGGCARRLDVGKLMRRTTACSGIGCRRSVSSVITASVPSEPTRSPVRS